MDDIVNRLMKSYKEADEVSCVFLAKEAAEEIRRTREERDYYRDIELGECRDEYRKLFAKYERALRNEY